MTCQDCTDDCRQGRDCPHRKVFQMTDKFKVWVIAWVIGFTFGGLAGQQILITSIKKDCEVLTKFRINDIPYNCRP